MFRLESSVSKKSCLRCTRTWCFGGQQKKTTNNNNFFFFFRPSSFYFKYFMLSTLIDYLVFNASTKAFFCRVVSMTLDNSTTSGFLHAFGDPLCHESLFPLTDDDDNVEPHKRRNRACQTIWDTL